MVWSYSLSQFLQREAKRRITRPFKSMHTNLLRFPQHSFIYNSGLLGVGNMRPKGDEKGSIFVVTCKFDHLKATEVQSSGRNGNKGGSLRR